MFGLPTWLLIVPLLGFLVFVHEMGHFIFAKRFGVRVNEFGFGFPPRLFGVRYGETLYSVNLIPLGGFVRMAGEEDPTDPRSFASRPVLQRAVVLVAGSFMNLAVPVVIFTVLFMMPRDTAVGSVLITSVDPGSPAQRAGLRPGDVVLRVDGDRIDNHVELVQKVMTRLGSSTELTVRRAPLVPELGSSPEYAVIESVKVVPRLNPTRRLVVEEVSDPASEVSLVEARRFDPGLQVGDHLRQGPIGIGIATLNPKIVKRSHPFWTAVPMGLGRIRDVLLITKNGIVSWIAGGPDPGLAGPVGIARVTGEVAKVGISPVFELTAVISISLAIVNVLPIPALDGGRLMFVLLEWVRRGKRISPQREGLVHAAGFMILVGLIIVISYFDIARIVSGGSVLR